MKKSRLVIKFIRNHNVANEYINKLKLSNNNNNTIGCFVLDMIIRWNSSCLLLDRLIDHKDIMNSMFSFPNNIFGLTEKEKKTT